MAAVAVVIPVAGVSSGSAFGVPLAKEVAHFATPDGNGLRRRFGTASRRKRY